MRGGVSKYIRCAAPNRIPTENLELIRTRIDD
jgi:hypothetical protein